MPWELADDPAAATPGDADPLGRLTHAVRRISRDNVLGILPAEMMGLGAKTVRDQLDHLAILILFSVFEAEVRDWLAERVRPELAGLHEPILKDAGQDVLQTIGQGSFARLLAPYKEVASPGLVEAVSQVRAFRNWVAHGRRDDMRPKEQVEPRMAYERLSEFLAALRRTAAPT